MRELVPWALACALVAASGCVASSPAAVFGQEQVLVLEVAPDLVPCVGEMEGRCLQVHAPGEVEWQTFYDPIEGFQHEEGVGYTLEVGRRAVPDPPADGSAYAYRLLRVIAREPASAPGP
ncbi:MAG TPA: DUF4377 domain-containing protein [Longimicrobiales bacterium]|nr:DUF4377 domain-containing protein [Longimicrobiales bacterium]